MTSHAREASLIPRQALFGAPERARPCLAPDGRQVAYLAPLHGTQQVWLAPVDDLAAARPLRADGRPPRDLCWSRDGRYLLYRQDAQGDENHRLFGFDPRSGERREWAGGAGSNVALLATSARAPSSLLLEWNVRDARHADIYRLDLDSGALREVLRNDAGYASFVSDRELRPRLGVRQTPAGGYEVERLDAPAGARLFLEIPAPDALATRLLGIDDQERVYLLDSRGRDTAALVTLPLDGGPAHVLGESALADVSDVLAHPCSGALEAYAVHHARRRWHAVGAHLVADLQRLDEWLCDWEVLGRSDDDEVWLLRQDPGCAPLAYWLYLRATGELRLLFGSRPALAGRRFAPMHELQITTRDRLRLVSYLTLPPDAARLGEERPAQPVPLVLYVHGGPWARVEWGFDPLHQWLADRGYAVLAVNFRGSAGFGKRFQNAADGEFGGRMQDDLLDAVQWAVERGIADPERVALLGESYGGYATLNALALTPDLFACGVDLVGPSNLQTLIESFPASATPFLEATWYRRVGDPRTPEGRQRLRRASPLTHVARVRRPLLVAHGARDPRVRQSESEQFVAALAARGVPVTLALYADEGHGFARHANWVSFFALVESFLARHLAGRCQPIGDDLDDSSLSVPVGAEHVPGLLEALARRQAALLV